MRVKYYLYFIFGCAFILNCCFNLPLIFYSNLSYNLALKILIYLMLGILPMSVYLFAISYNWKIFMLGIFLFLLASLVYLYIDSNNLDLINIFVPNKDIELLDNWKSIFIAHIIAIYLSYILSKIYKAIIRHTDKSVIKSTSILCFMLFISLSFLSHLEVNKIFLPYKIIGDFIKYINLKE